jgi:hypothetical protein
VPTIFFNEIGRLTSLRVRFPFPLFVPVVDRAGQSQGFEVLSLSSQLVRIYGVTIDCQA